MQDLVKVVRNMGLNTVIVLIPVLILVSYLSSREIGERLCRCAYSCYIALSRRLRARQARAHTHAHTCAHTRAHTQS